MSVKQKCETREGMLYSVCCIVPYCKFKTLNQNIGPPTMVVLKVYIPLLADKVPHGWTVSLVDNPGFGEAKEHVVQLADASLLTSSAYIYLLQTENIGGTEAADFFKELDRLDKSNA